MTWVVRHGRGRADTQPLLVKPRLPE